MELLGLEHVYWQLPLVAYPFLSGLVAGSFIVGSLSKVFVLSKFEPLAKLSVIVTFAFLVVAALAPLAEAVQRMRWWELYTRDHIPYSPLGLFIVIWTAYIILVVAEMYFIFRVDNIRLAAQAQGWRRRWHNLLTFGSRDISARSLRRDHAVLVVLAVTGILLALGFHGYVGFVFGALKARPLWSNPLMPPLFIMSAIVSGIAVMIVAYVLIQGGLSADPIDRGILDGLMKFLMWMILVDLFLDLVDLLNAGVSAYTSLAVYRGFSAIFFLGGPLAVMYWVLQLGLLLLALVMTFFRGIRRSPLWASITGLAVLISVFAMRYDTVIGGELQPKVSQGLVRYTPVLFGIDSWQVLFGLAAIAIFLIGLSLLLLPWEPSWVTAWLGRGGNDGQKIEAGASSAEVGG